MAACFAGCADKQQQQVPATKEDQPYQAFVMQKSTSDTSWGYIIMHRNMLMIEQFTVPVLSGEQHFKNKAAASAVAKLVVQKLNHRLPPGVTRRELDSLGIIQ